MLQRITVDIASFNAFSTQILNLLKRQLSPSPAGVPVGWPITNLIGHESIDRCNNKYNVSIIF